MKRIETRKMYLVCLFILTVFSVLPGCGDGVFGGGEWNKPITLVSIEVTPPNQSIAKGTTQQFMATGIYSDNSKKDLTSTVVWTSSNSAVASIDNSTGYFGVATAKTVGGPITITATVPGTGKSGTAPLTVTAATLVSIGVTSLNANIALGTTQQFVATGVYSDLTTQNLTSSVTWSSSNAAAATISNTVGSNGLVTPKTFGGPITITATDPGTGKTGTASLTVTAATLTSMGITPVNASNVPGTLQQYIATGVYSDFTTQNLTSSVTWSSSNEAVATISNAAGSSGVATSKTSVGPVTITATDPGTGKSASATLTVTSATLTSITVTPATASIAPGTTQQFIATGIYSDFSTQNLTSSITWSSSNAAVAFISNAAGSNGLVTSRAGGGPVTITAIDPATGKSGATTLTVTSATLTSITVTPATASIALGTTQQFIATGIYSDLSTQNLTSSVTWTSSNAAVATISNAAGSYGFCTSVTAGGPVTITATDPASGKSGTAALTVTSASLASIKVTPVTVGMGVGETNNFIATGTYSDLTTQNLTSSVTWSTSNTAVAAISNAAGSNGLATTLAVGGPVTITATDPVSHKNGTGTLVATKAPNLRTVKSFGVFGGTAGMTNMGTLSVFNGDIGTIATTTSSITGFHDLNGDIYTETGSNIGTVNGTIFSCTNSTTGPTSAGPNAAACVTASKSRLDAQSAYQYLTALPAGANPGNNLANQTLLPGVYTAPAGSFLIQGGDLTLDAQGDANAIWVFQMATTLTVGGPGAAFPQSIILAGGAQARNVFWQVGSFATINAAGGGTMVGTIISQTGASFSTAGNVAIVTMKGRVLSLGASVTLVNTAITLP